MRAISKILLSIFVLNIVDVITTLYILSIGGVELNPLFSEIGPPQVAFKIFYVSILCTAYYFAYLKAENCSTIRTGLVVGSYAMMIFLIFCAANNFVWIFVSLL